jgi:hypothetical protein
MEKFKIRCSAIGNIMAKPKKKEELISKTAQTYCKKWYKEQIYNRKEEVFSKYFDKGNIVEDNSIDFIAKYLDYDSLLKNERSYENEYMTGTPDLVTGDGVIEVKNSWNCFSFPLLEDKIPNINYFYQVQGYMKLTGLNKARLIYTLMDTPENLIEKEFQYNSDNNFLEYNDFREKYMFSNVEHKYRIKIFEINYDKKVINEIIERVEKCREYLDKLWRNNNF